MRNQSFLKTSSSASYQVHPMSVVRVSKSLDIFMSCALFLLELHFDFCSGLRADDEAGETTFSGLLTSSLLLLSFAAVSSFRFLLTPVRWSFEFARIELFSIFCWSPCSSVFLFLLLFGLKKEVILFVFSLEDIF